MADTPIHDELAYQVELAKTLAAIQAMNQTIWIPRTPGEVGTWLTRYVNGRRN